MRARSPAPAPWSRQSSCSTPPALALWRRRSLHRRISVSKRCRRARRCARFRSTSVCTTTIGACGATPTTASTATRARTSCCASRRWWPTATLRASGRRSNKTQRAHILIGNAHSLYTYAARPRQAARQAAGARHGRLLHTCALGRRRIDVCAADCAPHVEQIVDQLAIAQYGVERGQNLWREKRLRALAAHCCLECLERAVNGGETCCGAARRAAKRDRKRVLEHKAARERVRAAAQADQKVGVVRQAQHEPNIVAQVRAALSHFWAQKTNLLGCARTHRQR